MGRKLIAELDAEFIEEDLRPYIEYRVTVGFGDEAQIVDDAVDEFKEYFRKAALIPEARRLCAEAIARHVASQQSWPAVTDCDKLDRAFEALEALGIIARHDFTCCGSCGVLEMWDLIDRIELFEEGRKVVGYTFYNEQDTQSAIDNNGILLNYGSVGDSEDEGLAVGRLIVETLRAVGLSPKWDGNLEKRIALPLDWKRRRGSS